MMVMIFYGGDHLNVRHRNFAPCIIGSDLSRLQNTALREHDCDRANNEKVPFDVGVGGGDDVEVDGEGMVRLVVHVIVEMMTLVTIF